MLSFIPALLCFAAAAFLLGDWLYRKKRCTVPVRARVTEIQHQKAGRLRKKSRNFYPVYTFTYDQRSYTIRAREPSRTNRWEVGEEIELFIAPDDPDCFREGRQTGDLVYAGLALAMGLLFLYAARLT